MTIEDDEEIGVGVGQRVNGLERLEAIDMKESEESVLSVLDWRDLRR